MATRNIFKLWITGRAPEKDISGARLPSRQTKTIATTTAETSDKLRDIWTEAARPYKCKENRRIISQLKKCTL